MRVDGSTMSAVGRIVRTEIQLPSGESVYECPECGIDLEPEDFWIARQKGSV